MLVLKILRGILRYFYLGDELIEDVLFVCRLTNLCQIDLILEIGPPVVIGVVQGRVELGHLNVLIWMSSTSS